MHLPARCLMSLAVALLATGCLKSSLTIPTDELARIARDPGKAQGLQQIRVVQDTTFANSPSGPDPCADHDHPPIQLHLHGHHHHHRHGFHVGHGHHRPIPSGVDRSGPGKPQPIPANGGGKVNTGGGGGNLDFDIDDGKAMIVAVIAIAAVGTIALIATEGMRYDGWVEISPNHPVHLLDGKRQRVVHLRDLEPRHIGPSTRAVIRPRDGIGARRIGRAPLDREGFVWRMEMGGREVLTPDGADPINFASTMQFGYFPLQSLGVLLTTTLSTGYYDRNDLIGARYGIETQYLPLALGRFHLGAFGMVGQTYEARDNGHLRAGESNRFTLGTGAIAEIDLTTRLALSMRAGAHWREYGDSGFDRPAMSATIGFAIY